MCTYICINYDVSLMHVIVLIEMFIYIIIVSLI